MNKKHLIIMAGMMILAAASVSAAGRGNSLAQPQTAGRGYANVQVAQSVAGGRGFAAAQQVAQPATSGHGYGAAQQVVQPTMGGRGYGAAQQAVQVAGRGYGATQQVAQPMMGKWGNGYALSDDESTFQGLRTRIADPESEDCTCEGEDCPALEGSGTPLYGRRNDTVNNGFFGRGQGRLILEADDSEAIVDGSTDETLDE